MQAIQLLSHFLNKRRVKQIQKEEGASNEALEERLRQQYKDEFNAVNKIKVFIYQTGFHYHFTRFYRSTLSKEFNFYLVDNIKDAEVIVFINAIAPEVVLPHQKVVLFFHEPTSYSHLYQSIIPSDFLGQRDITVVSHIEPSQFMMGDFFRLPDARITHIKSIPHVHFHHMATEDELMAIPVEKTKSICSVVSGFNGVPGYEDRRIFLEQFSKALPEFDLYGRYGKTIRDIPSYRGYSAVKFKTIADYKYNLVIENSNEDWYISEKIFDALMCGCMPIYYGTNKIFDLIPHDWFYYLPDLNQSNIKNAEELIHSNQYKLVSRNRIKIAAEIDRSFSFYRQVHNLLSDQI